MWNRLLIVRGYRRLNDATGAPADLADDENADDDGEPMGNISANRIGSSRRRIGNVDRCRRRALVE